MPAAPSSDSDDILLARLVEALSAVPGLAIVLGGSRARGTHHAGSDFDLGLYYDPTRPPDWSLLDDCVRGLDDEGRRGLCNRPGDWGPWINGGAWLSVAGRPVDLLYRDRRRVDAVVAQCLAGQIELAVQPGHPFGFVSAIYLAELAVCRVLHDPDAWLAQATARVHPYPEALRQALIGRFGWEMRFALETGRKAAARQDLNYAAGSAFRAVCCMCQVLLALDGSHWLNEKGAVMQVESCRLHPDDFARRVGEAYAELGQVDGILHGYSRMAALIAETERLAGLA